MSINKVTTSQTTQTKTTTKTDTETTKKKTTWFGKFGNWFNKNSSKIGASMSILGNSAMNIGMDIAQFEMTREMLKTGSIWGMGGYMYGGGMFGCRSFGGGSWMMNGDPLGLTWAGGGYDTYNPYYTQMGNQMAFNYGYQMAQQGAYTQGYSQGFFNPTDTYQTRQIIQNDATAPLQPEANKFAKLNVSEQDETEGHNFDEVTNNFVDEEGEAISGKEYDLEVKADKDGKFSSDYKAKVSELGKSYLANIEKTTGDVDNKGIDLKEFKKHEMKKLPADATDEQIEEAEARTENAFKKLDINDDGKIDWKEYSAAIMTFDQEAGTQPKGKANDGVITSEDYAAWSSLMGSEKTNLFDTSIRKNYKQLFDKE